MDEILIKREIEKTKKYIELNNYSKEDAIRFLEAKMEIAAHTDNKVAAIASKMLLEECINKD